MRRSERGIFLILAPFLVVIVLTLGITVVLTSYHNNLKSKARLIASTVALELANMISAEPNKLFNDDFARSIMQTSVWVPSKDPYSLTVGNLAFPYGPAQPPGSGVDLRMYAGTLAGTQGFEWLLPTDLPMHVNLKRGMWRDGHFVSLENYEEWDDSFPGIPREAVFNAVKVSVEGLSSPLPLSFLNKVFPRTSEIAVAIADDLSPICVAPFALPVCSIPFSLGVDETFGAPLPYGFFNNNTDRIFTEAGSYCDNVACDQSGARPLPGLPYRWIRSSEEVLSRQFGSETWRRTNVWSSIGNSLNNIYGFVGSVGQFGGNEFSFPVEGELENFDLSELEGSLDLCSLSSIAGKNEEGAPVLAAPNYDPSEFFYVKPAGFGSSTSSISAEAQQAIKAKEDLLWAYITGYANNRDLVSAYDHLMTVPPPSTTFGAYYSGLFQTQYSSPSNPLTSPPTYLPTLSSNTQSSRCNSGFCASSGRCNSKRLRQAMSSPGCGVTPCSESNALEHLWEYKVREVWVSVVAPVGPEAGDCTNSFYSATQVQNLSWRVIGYVPMTIYDVDLDAASYSNTAGVPPYYFSANSATRPCNAVFARLSVPVNFIAGNLSDGRKAQLVSEINIEQTQQD